MLTLNTILIPELNRNMISFRYIGGIYDPATIIIITCKTLDVCRVDINCDPNKPYNYDVYWFGVFSGIGSLRREYEISKDLVADIKKAIEHLKSRGENKMNKKMYHVSNIELRSSRSQMDEMTFTVNVLNSSYAEREDCDRIKEAIENIGKNNEIPVYRNGTWTPGLPYLYVGRGNGKSQFLKALYYNSIRFDIKDVIFNDPATIVLWADGTKTVVKAENEPFDPEKGLAMAISKRALGGKYNYYDTFKKYVGRYEKKQRKG